MLAGSEGLVFGVSAKGFLVVALSPAVTRDRGQLLAVTEVEVAPSRAT